MKNGHLLDHWQIWLWIGIAALILAAVARQYVIDIKGMSCFNANLIFLGVFVVFALLYLAFQEFISRTLGTALVKCFENLSRELRKFCLQFVESLNLTNKDIIASS